ncbi:H/ACA snoRNP pseudouridylase subunit [Perkinsus olseni]|uniref:H/ACA snoRNP pseudouridylase subunit n=1 Tax=Perkinsus olseni TaxID=32597 RepID=A0A7J6P5E3_PEROL|nr:H/ACA snoRNP pseudouridylase subunit [Perkinsus olseni]
MKGGFGKGKGKGGKGKGKGHRAPLGPPEWVEELGEMMHVCEDEMVCKCTHTKVPYFNGRVFLENKSQIGQVDEILGPINEFYFSVKMQEGVVAKSFKPGQKVYIDGNQTLPMERFLPVKKTIGPKKHAAGGKGKGGKGKGGKGKGGKGFGKGKGSGKGKGHSGKGSIMDSSFSIRIHHQMLLRLRAGPRLVSGLLKTRNCATAATAEAPPHRGPEGIDSWETEPPPPPPVQVYLNPICQQMDAKLRKLKTTEEILAAIITHRGVMFVQNLVTAVEMLAATVDDEAAGLVDVTKEGRYLMDQVMSAPVEEKQTRKNMLVNDLTRDPRYKLLLRDIGEYAENLDTRAIADVLGSLQSLGHRQFALCGKLLRTLYKPNLSVDSLHTMLEIAGGLQWMGFIRAHKFYASLALAVSRAPTLTMEEIALGLRAFGRLENVHPPFFEKVSTLVLQSDNSSLVPGLSLQLVTSLAIGFSRHRYPAHDGVVLACADYLADNIRSFSDRDMFKEMIAIVTALDNHQLAHPRAMTKVLQSCVPVAEEGLTWGEPMGHVIGLTSFGDLLQACANFGVGDDISYTLLPLERCLDLVDSSPSSLQQQSSSSLRYYDRGSSSFLELELRGQIERVVEP